MIYVVTLILSWVLLFVLIALVQTFLGSYRNPIEWWYHEIDTSPKAGVWYYGSLDAARRRVCEPDPRTDPGYDPSEPHRRK